MGILIPLSMYCRILLLLYLSAMVSIVPTLLTYTRLVFLSALLSGS